MYLTVQHVKRSYSWAIVGRIAQSPILQYL